MKAPRLWDLRSAPHGLPAAGFRGAVSLHSHTWHSREPLDFIQRVIARMPFAGPILGRVAKLLSTRTIDPACCFWRPPVSPLGAYRIETGQIAPLGLNPMVSITDHDDISACLDLHCLGLDVPISLEWSVPWGATSFHIGVHNLPPAEARGIAHALAEFTTRPRRRRLRELLEWLGGMPYTLLVLNHPFDNEERTTAAVHRGLVVEMLSLHRTQFHALELNGLKRLAENREVIRLAAECCLPVISGGDRHCLEPSANLNLTRAATFSEFVSDLRSGVPSEILFMPQYSEPIALRLAQTVIEAIGRYPSLHGAEHWTDRTFFVDDSGCTHSLASLWPVETAAIVRAILGAANVVAHPRMIAPLRSAFRSSAPFAFAAATPAAPA
jgi:hypothetical protein